MPDIEDALTDLAQTKDDSPSMGVVLREIFRAFGGAAEFAKQVKLDFDTCPAGHANRIRIEADILRSLGSFDGDMDETPDDIETLKATAKQLLAEQ